MGGAKKRGELVKGRWREGKSAGLCSEGIQRRYVGACDLEMAVERRRRSLARRGWWAPDVREAAEKMDEVESEMRQKELQKPEANRYVRTKAKSSTSCCDDW